MASFICAIQFPLPCLLIEPMYFISCMFVCLIAFCSDFFHNLFSFIVYLILSQNWNLQDHPFMHGQSAQQQAGAHRASSPNLLYQQPLRVPQSRSHSPNVVRSSSPLAPAQTQQGVAQVGVGNSAGATNSQQSRLMVAAQLAAQRVRQPPSVPVQIQTSGAGASYLTSADGIRAPTTEQRGNVGTEGLVDLASQQNWRPTGRMRGSLSGRAYSAALKEFMIQPTQQTQTPTPRPPPNLPPSQSSMPPHLQFLLARNAQSSTGTE